MVGYIESFKKASLSRINGFVPEITKIMGVALVLYALLVFYSEVRFPDETMGPYLTTGAYLMIIIGTLILLDFSFNIYRAIGLYAIAIALNRIVKFVFYLDPPSGAVFVFAVVMIALSVNMIITGVNFLKGSNRGRTSMIRNSLLMLALNVVAIFYLFRNTTENLLDVVLLYPETFALIAMYIILVAMLSSEPVRMNEVDEKYNVVLNNIKLINTYNTSTHITDADADILVRSFDDRSSWTSVDDSGPVENEFVFTIYHDAVERVYVTVQKWKDSDKLYFTISDHTDGSLLSAYRFYADRIVSSESDGKRYLSLFNKDGLHIKLSVWGSEASS